MKKLLSVALTSTMVMGLVAGCSSSEKPSSSESGQATTQEGTQGQGQAAADDHEPMTARTEDPMQLVPQADILKFVPKEEPTGKVVMGTTTEPDEYVYSGFTNPSSNAEMRRLIGGYAPISLDRNNELVVNNIVTKDLKREENPDGTVTYTIEIYDNLKYSDGLAIEAKDYVFSVLAGSVHALTDIGGTANDGSSLVGFKEFNESDGTIPFKGVRLLDKYKYSFTIAKDELPNYFEAQLSIGSGPLAMVDYGEKMDVKDDGQGAYLTEPMTKESLNTLLLDPTNGLAFKPKRFTGPYTFVDFDKNNKALILEANPEYLGTFDGWKPRIKTIVIKYSNNKTILDELVNGSIDVMDPQGGAQSIQNGLKKVEESNGRLNVAKFDRNGYGLVEFHADHGATRSQKVRQAIAYALDRQEFLKTYTGGYGALVHSQYGLAQGEYKANKKILEKELNQYTFDLNESKKLLEEDGWTLDANGNAYTSGTRYRKNENGEMEALELNWPKTDTPVTELLLSRLIPNLEGLGFKVNVDQVDFPVMLKSLRAAPSDKENREKYNMFVLAKGFASVNPYWYYASMDPNYLSYNQLQLDDEELRTITEDMKKTKPGDKKAWYEKWVKMIKRHNELMTEIPLYSDLYHQFYDQQKLQNFEPTSLTGTAGALLYSSVK